MANDDKPLHLHIQGVASDVAMKQIKKVFDDVMKTPLAHLIVPMVHDAATFYISEPLPTFTRWPQEVEFFHNLIDFNLLRPNIPDANGDVYTADSIKVALKWKT